MSECWDPSRPSSDWCLGNSLHLRSAERRRRSLLACSADDDVNGIQIYGNIQRNKARFLIVPLNIFVLLAIEISKVKVFHICFSLRFPKHFRSLTLCVCLRFNLRQFFNSPAPTITMVGQGMGLIECGSIYAWRRMKATMEMGKWKGKCGGWTRCVRCACRKPNKRLINRLKRLIIEWERSWKIISIGNISKVCFKFRYD